MILTIRLKFGRIRIVEVKRYHSRPGRPSVTNPARHPPWRAWSVKIRECQAGPGRPSVMDPSSVADERHHDS
jgi:hypothetical protein